MCYAHVHVFPCTCIYLPSFRMEAMRESYGTHTKSLFPSPHPHSSHPHQAPPLTSHPHEKWVERSWIHPENASVDYSGLQRSSVDPLALPVMHHHHQSGRSASLSNRPLPNSWAIEIEQRRRVELQSMRERLEPSLHPRHTSSKPNISLLPTAVMRQLHNSNPNHSVSIHVQYPTTALHLIMCRRLWSLSNIFCLCLCSCQT